MERVLTGKESMSEQEISDIILKANYNKSNVEYYSYQYNEWRRTVYISIDDILKEIANGAIYRIKDTNY